MRPIWSLGTSWWYSRREKTMTQIGTTDEDAEYRCVREITRFFTVLFHLSTRRNAKMALTGVRSMGYSCSVRQRIVGVENSYCEGNLRTGKPRAIGGRKATGLQQKTAELPKGGSAVVFLGDRSSITSRGRLSLQEGQLRREAEAQSRGSSSGCGSSTGYAEGKPIHHSVR